MEKRPFFYCNQMSAGTSPYDIVFTFNRVGVPENAKPGTSVEPVIHESIDIAMGPSHAKTMLALIFDQLATYEKLFGEIPLDPEGKARYQALLAQIKK